MMVSRLILTPILTGARHVDEVVFGRTHESGPGDPPNHMRPWISPRESARCSTRAECANLAQAAPAAGGPWR